MNSPFRILFAVALLWTLALPAGAATPAVIGYLFYRDRAYHPDNLATVVQVTAYKEFPDVTKATLASGQTVSVFAGQAPLFIPLAKSKLMPPADAQTLIAQATTRYPQHRALLTALAADWKTAAPAAGTQPAVAAAAPFTFTAKSGEIYQDATISHLDEKGVAIIYAAGATTVPYANLPTDLTAFPEDSRQKISAKVKEREAAAALKKN